VAPKVGQLPFVSPDHEYRRSRTDVLLPACTGALVVLTEPKVGERSVQAVSDDLSAAQFHFVDTAWRAAIPNLIPQTVYQKHPESGIVCNASLHHFSVI
jgi:hypothetical protein